MSHGHFDADLPRLCAANLRRARSGVVLPAYERSRTRPGVVHLGLGNFHRAHQAIFLERLLHAGDERWGVAGLSFRRSAIRNDLAPQDYLFAVHYDDERDRELRVVGCLKENIVIGEDRSRLADLLNSADVKIVTLTVTEKGYCRATPSNDLDFDHPDIQHDLAKSGAPRSAIGLIASMIALRERAGLPLPIFMSCDNLPANGRLLGRLVGQFMSAGYPDLAGCTEQSDLFPCSMVDRIVPELTEASGRKICRQLGLNDARPIDTEPFIQWVTEAAGSREGPDWALAGVTVTKDVQAYEVAKLRLLNGSHSAIAYLGYLAGYRSVSEAMADTDLSAFVDRLLNRELVTTVPETPGFNLADYARRLCDRFRNPGLLHKTAQIAMDGSQKIPQRLLDPIRARLARSEDSPCMAMAIAGWIRYVTGFDERGGRIDVKDPLVERLLALGRARNEPERLVDLALNIREVFGEDLGRDERFRRGLADSLRLLITRGARSAMKTLV